MYLRKQLEICQREKEEQHNKHISYIKTRNYEREILLEELVHTLRPHGTPPILSRPGTVASGEGSPLTFELNQLLSLSSSPSIVRSETETPVVPLWDLSADPSSPPG